MDRVLADPVVPTKDIPFLSPCALSEGFGFILLLEAGGGRGGDKGEKEEEEEEEGRRSGRGRRKKRRKALSFF